MCAPGQFAGGISFHAAGGETVGAQRDVPGSWQEKTTLSVLLHVQYQPSQQTEATFTWTFALKPSWQNAPLHAMLEKPDRRGPPEVG